MVDNCDPDTSNMESLQDYAQPESKNTQKKRPRRLDSSPSAENDDKQGSPVPQENVSSSEQIRPKENGYIRREFNERHAGSIPLEIIKSSIEYHKRVELEGAKHKYALCFGYLGSKYQGLQINPDALTIESLLEKALFLAGAVRECNFGNLQKLQWTRAARTDRGVHAIGQCCAMRLTINDKESFVNALNTFLPDDIRLFTLSKVTKAFDAKNLCSKRRYQYLLPTYVLENADTVLNLLETAFTEQGAIIGAGYEGGFADPKSKSFLGFEPLRKVKETLQTFRVDSTKLSLFRQALHKFTGTHSFHNYTSGKDVNDASSKRYIISFDCSDPFIDSSSTTEWVRLTVFGQSFLLNQIRRMVAMAVDIARGACKIEKMEDAFSRQKVDIPMVPGIGLYLDELFFDTYNSRVDFETRRNEKVAVKRLKNSNSTTSDTAEEDKIVPQKIDWSKDAGVQKLMLEFKETIVWKHIIAEEATGRHFMYYLDYLRVSNHQFNARPWQ